MGVGDSWGTREELLHPRDSKGRFRSKWKMSTAAMDRVLKVLSTFAPKTWPSDQEAATYVSGLAPKKGGKLPLERWGQMQADIRAGKPSKDLAAYKAAEQPLPEDLILTSVMDAKAFGLTPETLGQMEEYTGKLVANKGPTSTNVGTPVGPGQVTLSIAAPKGTMAVIPGGGSREVILSEEQPLRITKVDPDGKGGFYVYATAMPKGAKGETRTKKLGTRAPTPTDPDGDGIPGVAPGAPAAPGAAPADPNAPQPRVEQIQSPAVGGDGAPAADEVTPGAPDSPDTSPAPPSGKPEPATPEQGTPQGEPRVVPREPGTELTEFDKEVQRLAAEELAKRIEARAGGGGDSGGSNGAPGNAPSPEGDTPAPAKKAAKKAAPTPEESADLDRRVAQAERRKKAETREAIRPGAGAARREANDKMMAERKRQAEAPQEDDPDARALVDAAGQDMPDDPFLKMAIGLTAVQVKNGQLSRKKGADRIRELADGRPDKEKNTLRAVADQIEKQSAPKRAPKAAAPAKKATPETPAREVPDQVRADLGTATVGELRQIAKDEGVKIPSSVRRKADIRDLIQAQRDADKGPEVPAKKALAKKAAPTKASPIDRVTTRLVDRLGEIDPAVRDEILKDLDPSVRREIDAARERVEGGAPSVPAPAKKAPAKKVTAPVRSRDLDVERPKETPEQEKARVRDIVDTIKKENGADWAGLAEVRRRMGGTRQEQDATLRRLARQEGVSVIPAANLKALRGEDHDAAIVIGEQANHVISFEDPIPAPAREIRREPGVGSSNLDPLVDAPEALGGGQVPFGELRERAREAGIHVPVYITAKEARAFLDEELARRKTRDEGKLAPGDVVVQPTPQDVPRVVEASPETVKLVEDSSVADLRKAAKTLGVKVPANVRTKREVMQVLANAQAKNQVEPPAKKAAPKPSDLPVEIEPYLSGLDLDRIKANPDYVDTVRRDLAAGKKTPVEIGRSLEDAARRGLGVELGLRRAMLDQEQDPKRRAQITRELDKMQGELDELYRLAERMKFRGRQGRRKVAERPPDPTPTSLRESAKSGIKEQVDLTGGISADTVLVTYNDGTKAVRKKAHEHPLASSRSQADGEELTSLVARSLGIPSPRVERVDDETVLMEYVSDARVGQEVTQGLKYDDIMEIGKSDDGILIGLLDILMDNSDRNMSNWLVDGSGRIIPIDHGHAFTMDRRPGGSPDPTVPSRSAGIFSQSFRDLKRGTTELEWTDNPMSPEDMAAIKQRLTALRGEFERMGRGDWFEYMMKRLEVITPHAKGKKRRIEGA